MPDTVGMATPYTGNSGTYKTADDEGSKLLTQTLRCFETYSSKVWSAFNERQQLLVLAACRGSDSSSDFPNTVLPDDQAVDHALKVHVVTYRGNDLTSGSYA